MRVILEGNGRLAIDIIPGTGRGPHRDQDNRPQWPDGAVEPGGHPVRTPAEPEGHPHPTAGEPDGRAHHTETQRGELDKRLQLSSFASVEEELFSVLMFLLRRTRQQTGKIPSHAVLDSVVRAFDILLTVGKLPPATEWDRSLLTVLLVALEQAAARHGRGWLDELITHVRTSVQELDNPADGGEDDDGSDGSGPDDDGSTNDEGNGVGGGEPGHSGSRGPGNSVPQGSAPTNHKPEGGAPGTGYAEGSGPSDGRVANEWRGSPTEGADPSDDSTPDTATTEPVKKKE